MKTPYQIKKGLAVCATLDGDCENCPYDDGKQITCVDRSRRDALAYIIHLEFRLAQVEKERDAAKNDILKGCGTCKYNQSRCTNTEICSYTNDGMSGYEWRGVCAENTKEE